MYHDFQTDRQNELLGVEIIVEVIETDVQHLQKNEREYLIFR